MLKVINVVGKSKLAIHKLINKISHSSMGQIKKNQKVKLTNS